MITVTLPSEYIAVLKLFAAKNDIRYYINGISLEVWPTMDNGLCDGRLIATDGHRLGMFKLDGDNMGIDGQVGQAISVIIPNDLLISVKPGWPVSIAIGSGDTIQITVTQGVSTYSGQAIDGRFPDWRQFFSAKLSSEAAQFNPRYLADLGKAAKLFHGAKFNPGLKVTVSHNGVGAAIAGIGCDKFIGVLMPMRSDAPTVAPAWATESPAQAAAIELAQAA